MKVSTGRWLVVAAALAVAGCGTAASRVGEATTPGGGGHTTNQLPVRRAPTPDQVAQRLITAARAPSGAVESAVSPTSSLRYPPDRSTAAGTIVRYRWWRLAMPWHAAYSWVARNQPDFLRSGSSGSASGPSLSDVEQNVDFTPDNMPLSVNSAILTIAVVPVTATTSAIGAYAVVIRQPTRPAAENVPLNLATVTVTARRTTGSPGGGPVFSRRTVTGSQARVLVRDFDELSVQPPGQTFSCPMAIETESATFRTNAHVWVATSGICDSVTVTVDGHRLPTLDDSQQFDRDLRGGLTLGVRKPAMTSPPIR